MIPIDEIYDVTRSWVLLVSGLPDKKVVKYAQNAPEPTGQMAVINPAVSSVAVSIKDDVVYTAPGTYTIRSPREVLCSVNAYGRGAVALLSAVQNTAEAPSVQALLRAEKIALVEVRQVRDLTGLKNARTEERAQVDILYRVSTQFDDTTTPVMAQIEYDIEVGTDTVSDTVGDPYTPPDP